MKKRSFLDQALHEATLKERERIIKLLEDMAIAPLLFDDIMTKSQFKIPDGSDVVLINDAYQALDKQLWHLIELMQDGETK